MTEPRYNLGDLNDPALPPDATAIIDLREPGRPRHYSHADIRALSGGVARWLASRRLSRGARVAIASLNRAEYLIAYFGIMRAGLVAVPLNIKQPQEALDYVLGYTCLNDITARDVQKADGQWARGKNMDGFAPMGPVVTDEVDPEHLTITTRLNGQVVQQGRTEQLITGVRALISFITASMTLEPGDVIATGTPAGVGPMQPGDTVEVEVSGIGILCNTIV